MKEKIFLSGKVEAVTFYVFCYFYFSIKLTGYCFSGVAFEAHFLSFKHRVGFKFRMGDDFNMGGGGYLY
ncbi:hypothetical protein [uncultured Cedecea sp.]|uniref:hypothetical protein n=1 Tax=uncultured Cedecea sp. TaxID=988762 RepID=UPI0026284FC9|nr:hypothetical protein [uncultured Cedecea sp.]